MTVVRKLIVTTEVLVIRGAHPHAHVWHLEMTVVPSRIVIQNPEVLGVFPPESVSPLQRIVILNIVRWIPIVMYPPHVMSSSEESISVIKNNHTESY